MTTGLQTQERATYDEIWALPQYSEYAPGEHFIDVFMSLVAPNTSVLDAGCGSGKGSVVLKERGFKVMACDISHNGFEKLPVLFAEACLWHDLAPVVYLAKTSYILRDKDQRFEYVYCCDVMEHIPTPFTMLVVQNLLNVCRHGVFFSISLTSDHFGVWVGKHLHQTVQSFTLWRDQLRELGHLTEARDLGTTGLYFVEPIR